MDAITTAAPTHSLRERMLQDTGGFRTQAPETLHKGRHAGPSARCPIADIGKIVSISAMSFSYGISLQVRHPDADPDDIIREVGLPARRSWKMGEPRSTPRGTALPGHYDKTYCVFDLGVGDDGELADHLRSKIATFIPKREFLLGLRATGGSLNLFITWAIGERGEVFDCSLLSDLVSLGIDLGIEPIKAD